MINDRLQTFKYATCVNDGRIRIRIDTLDSHRISLLHSGVLQDKYITLNLAVASKMRLKAPKPGCRIAFRLTREL